MARIKVRKSYEKEGFKRPVFEYRPDWPYISIGFGNERDYFIENLSLLISSGMGISSALSALSLSVKTMKMKKLTAAVESMVNSGIPLWKALSETRIVNERDISLIRSGEQSGKLVEHLNLVTLQQNKEKLFKSRLRSVLLYPGIVLFFSMAILISSFWLILPRFVSFFEEMDAEMPFITRVLISIGIFFQNYGFFVVPLVILFFILITYLLFFNKKTKFIGDSILFSLPGIKNLVQGVELAYFGYIFGALMQAGLEIKDSFEILQKGTRYDSYRNLYGNIKDRIIKGESFKKILLEYPKIDKYIPVPIQQLIFSAEKSGRLPEIFIRIGVIFEEKTEAMSRDLTTVLEPVILIIVGIIVGFVVISIMGPLYGLSTQF